MSMIMFNMVLQFKFIYNPKNYNCDNPNNPPNYVFTLTPYPCQWTRYSKHLWKTHNLKKNSTSNSFSSSILISEVGWICFLGSVDSWKGSRIETWNIGWIFNNFESCNQNVIWIYLANERKWLKSLVIQFLWRPCTL
jgi:hypothetical protein